MTEILQWLNT